MKVEDFPKVTEQVWLPSKFNSALILECGVQYQVEWTVFHSLNSQNNHFILYILTWFCFLVYLWLLSYDLKTRYLNQTYHVLTSYKTSTQHGTGTTHECGLQVGVKKKVKQPRLNKSEWTMNHLKRVLGLRWTRKVLTH